MKLLIFNELVSSRAFYGALGELARSGVFSKQKTIEWVGDTSQAIPSLQSNSTGDCCFLTKPLSFFMM